MSTGETETEPIGRGPTILAGLAVALFTLAVFASIVGFQFVNSDDANNIFLNPYINPPTAKGLAYLWTHGYYELYMPVTYTLWAIAAAMAHVSSPIYVPGGGYSTLNPAVFHGMSLLLHTANALLVFALLLRRIRKPWPAAAGALLFALHPMQIESVAWVTGMNNMTSGFFGLLALLMYLDYAGTPQNQQRSRALRYTAATLFYVLALFSKPTAAALPLVAAVLDWGMLRRAPARWAKPLALWAALALVIAVVTRFTSADVSDSVHMPIWARPFIAGDALSVYLAKLLLLPPRMAIRSDRSLYVVESHWWGYVTWLFPAALGLLLLRLGERGRVAATAFLVFIAALLPMLGFIPYYALVDSTVADRYLYLAMLGPGLLLAWFAARPGIQGAIRTGVTSLLLAGFTLYTLFRLPAWHDTYALATAQVAVRANDAEAQTNYAISLANKGDIAGALPHFRAAVEIKPGKAIYQYHLGATLADSGDLAGAVAPLQEAVRLDPRFAEAQMRLGTTLAKLGRAREALGPLRAAAQLHPDDAATHYILGVLLGNDRDDAGAAAEFDRVIQLNPGFADAYFSLGRIQERQGKIAEARASYRNALRLAPGNTAARDALQHLTQGKP